VFLPVNLHQIFGLMTRVVETLCYSDVDQGEKTLEVQAQQTQVQSEAQAQPMITSSTMPQRITKSKAQALGEKHQLVSLFVISL